MNKTAQNIRDRVLSRIEQGEVKMRPRIITLMKAVALGVLVLAALLLSVFLFNFIFFFLRINHFPLRYGRGFLGIPFDLLRFVLLFPWWLLAIDAGLLILAEVLLRQFRFAYRRPVLLSLFALLALTLALGLAIDRATSVNETLEWHAHHGRLPAPIGDMYRHARHDQDGMLEYASTSPSTH